MSEHFCDPRPAHCLEAMGGEQGLTADELEIARLRRELGEALAKIAELTRYAESTIGSLIEGHEVAAKIIRATKAERDDARAKLAAVRVALRDLVASVAATNTRDTIVLRDIDAARAVLEGRS